MAFGLATLTGVARRGFFIPYRYAAGQDAGLRAPAVERLFDAHLPAMLSVAGTLRTMAPALIAIDRKAPAPNPRWEQDWFCGLDAAILYQFILTRRPTRIIEIGSGHSTRFAVRALQDAGLAAGCLTAIDPAPRADIRTLGIGLTQTTVQHADPAMFAALGPGDILSIDSSHIAMPGTDLDWLTGNVLPMLVGGVLLHVHDIFLPDPYPQAWTWRGYNEQIVVAALMAGGGFTPLFASYWMQTANREALLTALGSDFPWTHIAPPKGGHESSLWLVRS